MVTVNDVTNSGSLTPSGAGDRIQIVQLIDLQSQINTIVTGLSDEGKVAETKKFLVTINGNHTSTGYGRPFPRCEFALIFAEPGATILNWKSGGTVLEDVLNSAINKDFRFVRRGIVDFNKNVQWMLHFGSDGIIDGYKVISYIPTTHFDLTKAVRRLISKYLDPISKGVSGTAPTVALIAMIHSEATAGATDWDIYFQTHYLWEYEPVKNRSMTF